MMIDAMVAPKVGFISPFGTTVCNVNHSNVLLELPDVEGMRTASWPGTAPADSIAGSRGISDLGSRSGRPPSGTG